MNNEFSFEITDESKNAINEILKQQGLRHFKLYTDFYGELDVINYEEYQKLEKEKDKEIEELNDLLHKANDEVVSYADECIRLNNIMDESIEDISFCLHSITQEKIASRDSRTRQEMSTCEHILRERLDKLKEGKENDK